jgi:hypothetical protein
MAWTLGRLTLVDGMAIGSSRISGWYGLWVVLHKWVSWSIGRLTVVDEMAFG